MKNYENLQPQNQSKNSGIKFVAANFKVGFNIARNKLEISMKIYKNL